MDRWLDIALRRFLAIVGRLRLGLSVVGRVGGWWGLLVLPAREGMKARAARYQMQITGRRVDDAYWVNGVKFDSYVPGMLIDAKGPGYAGLMKNGKFRDGFKVKDDLIEQARRQTRAADGHPITWKVAEKEAADAMRKLLRDEGYGNIKIVHVPAK